MPDGGGHEFGTWEHHNELHWRGAMKCSEIMDRVRPSARCEMCNASALSLEAIGLEQFGVSSLAIDVVEQHVQQVHICSLSSLYR